MIEIMLEEGQSGYDAVDEYIIRYWDHNGVDTLIVSIGISYDGHKYNMVNEVASPLDFYDIEYLYDWWEGEKFIRIYGIKAIRELDISGGVYSSE